MPKRRPLRTVDAAFLDAAPIRNRMTQVIPASAAETFRALEDAESWPAFIDAINEVEWTAPKPFGVGTTRIIRGPVLDAGETFIGWEDGRSMTFYFHEAAGPVFAAFCEEWTVEPVDDTSCTLTWRYGVELNKRMRLLQGPFGKVFARQGAKSLEKLAEYMTANREKYQA